MINLEKIDFEKQNGIIPVVAQDSTSLEILMVAYTNKEALEFTLKTGYAHYFSRSKQRLWKKGEESGHTQKIMEILLDCDNDTLVYKIEQKGVACHTGRKSCFFTNLKNDEIISDTLVEPTSTYGIIDVLYHTIIERKKCENGDY